MASFGGDWVTNPHTQIQWGLDYIKRRYGDPDSAWGHSQKVGWYASGTENARRGLAVVGEDGAELVDFRGGERVIPHRESLDIARASTHLAVEPGEAPGSTTSEYHAHFDGASSAALQATVQTAFAVMDVAAGHRERIGRRR